MIIQRLLICIFLFVSINIFGQNRTFNSDNILVGKRKLPSVLLVGTFHFDYPNRDVNKTSEDKQVNVLTDKRQLEIEQLVEYIAKFKPTKIVIEWKPESNSLIRKYRAFKNGTVKMDRDEIEQIGFRLLTKFKLDTLYGANAGSIFDDLYDSKDSLVLRPALDKIFSGWQNYNYKCDEPVCSLQDSLSKFETELQLKWTLLEFFKYYNSDKTLNRNYGGYFSGEYFKQGKFRGADALSMEWYNRNLRIFRNIQNIPTTASDRILVLFGAGHISLLKQIFECDPNYNLIKFNDLK